MPCCKVYRVPFKQNMLYVVHGAVSSAVSPDFSVSSAITAPGVWQKLTVVIAAKLAER